MFTSPTLSVKAGHGRFVSHGRLHQRSPTIQQAPEETADGTGGPVPWPDDPDIFEIARRRAREFGRLTFVISHWDNAHWNVVFAGTRRLTANDIIEYAVWPPGWFYRPNGNGQRRQHG